MTFKLGILGGVGPEATTEFVDRIQQRTNADTDQEHVRLIADIDSQIPPRDPGITNDGIERAEIRQHLRENASRLSEIDCTHLIIASNATHYFYDSVSEQVSIPVLHMPKMAVQRCKDNGYDSVTVFGSNGCRASGVYDGYDNVDINFPSEGVHSSIHTAIFALKAGEVERAQSLLDSAVKNTAGPYLIACTELSMLELPKKSIDAMDVAADEIVCLWRREK